MSQKCVLITGAAGGLGSVLCQLLIERGHQVAAIDHNEQALNQLEERINAKQSLYSYTCDITDYQAITMCCRQAQQQLNGLDWVIHAAGITHIEPFSDSNPQAIERVMAVNFQGAVNVCSATLVALRASKGTHVAISSVAGFAPLIRRSAYSASKHAMQGFFSSLREEEQAYGVSVVIASPSFIATNSIVDEGTRHDPVNKTAQRPGSASDGVDYMSPTAAAEAILSGIEKNKPRLFIGRVALLSWYVNRLSPRLYAWLMRRKIGE